MPYDRLLSLADSYPQTERARLLALDRERAMRDEHEVLELAAIAAETQVDSLVDSALDPNFDPLLRRAFELAYPNVNPDSLGGRSAEALGGFLNGVKGKYFEVLVEDRLNAGQAVGGLKLAAGQTARLAESATQPGWDLEIVGKGGAVVDQLQLKATEHYNPVYAALNKYPDIKVLTPGRMDQFGDRVVSADLAHRELLGASDAYVDELGDGLLENAFESVARFALKVVPLSSIVLVAGTEGARFLMGRATLQDAMGSGGTRIARSTAYNAVAQALIAAGLGPAAIPATMALRVAETRVRERVALADGLAERVTELRALLPRDAGEAPTRSALPGA